MLMFSSWLYIPYESNETLLIFFTALERFFFFFNVEEDVRNSLTLETFRMPTHMVRTLDEFVVPFQPFLSSRRGGALANSPECAWEGLREWDVSSVTRVRVGREFLVHLV